jgi:NAD(P)H-flavin reductase
MKTASHQVTCMYNKNLAKDIYEIRFTKPKNLDFTAGQFALLSVPLVDDPSDVETRALSIASAPHEPDLLFVNKNREGGRMSRWIEEVLCEGTEVEIQGPFGVFVLPEDLQHDLVMICTSTGVAPFRSQVLELLSHGFDKKIDLVFGVRGEEDLFWLDEFAALADAHDTFTFHAALSQPGDTWEGQVGRVQDVILNVISDLPQRFIFICGNPDMTKEIKELCLNSWSVPKEHVHMEGYI